MLSRCFAEIENSINVVVKSQVVSHATGNDQNNGRRMRALARVDRKLCARSPALLLGLRLLISRCVRWADSEEICIFLHSCKCTYIHLYNYFRLHVCLSLRSSVRTSVRMSHFLFFKIPAVASHTGSSEGTEKWGVKAQKWGVKNQNSTKIFL